MRYRNYFVFYGSVSENAKLNKNSVVFWKKKFAIIMRDGNFLLILCHNGSRWFVIDSALLTNKLHSCFFFHKKLFIIAYCQMNFQGILNSIQCYTLDPQL